VAPSTYHADDGAAYERFLGRWTQRLAEPFIELAGLPADGDVLDVGCGTGSLAQSLARHRPSGRIAGIDIAEPYIDFARRREGTERAQLEVGDACRLRFADQEFAGALAQLVLNFVPDALAAVREMRRVTRAGGIVAAAVWDFRGGLVYQRLFWDTAAAIDPEAAAARDRLFSHPLALPGGLSGLWQEAGLMRIEQGSLTIRMDYGGFRDYWEPLLGGQGPVGAYVGSLSADVRADIEGRVRAAYLSGAPDGPRSMTATAWAVRGVAA
jgi:SAM-dependent methyltransferase